MVLQVAGNCEKWMTRFGYLWGILWVLSLLLRHVCWEVVVCVVDVDECTVDVRYAFCRLC